MARLYQFYGQSNSRGAAPNADLHPSLAGVHPNIKVWNGTAFASLEVGVNQQYPTPTTLHGAQVAFLYNEQIRVGEVIYAVMYGIGDTPLHDDGTLLTWFPSKAGALVDISISTFNNALANMWNTLGIRTFKFFFVWQQGEADTTVDADANAYVTNLPNLITKFNANIAGTALATSNKYWILVKISTGTSYDATRRGTINTAMNTVAAADSTNRFTHDPTGNLLQADLHHYEASGYKNQGQNMVTGITSANNL